MSVRAEPLNFCPHCWRDYPRYPIGHARAGEVISRSCKRRTCPAYGEIYLRDLGECFRAALAEWKAGITMPTLTGPGADQLPFDVSLCKLQGEHKHSGSLGCQVNPWVAAQYNLEITSNWSQLHKRAVARCRNRGLKPPVLLGFVVEIHKRGVFHLHPVIGYYPDQRHTGLKVYINALRDLRGNYGFGTGRRGSWHPGEPGRFFGEDAARYVTKYLRPREAKRSFVPALRMLEAIIPRKPDVNGRPRPVRQVRPVYINPRLTRKSGITMRFLRFARYAFVKWRAALPLPELLAIYKLVRTFGAELLEHDPGQPNPPPVDQAEDDIPF